MHSEIHEGGECKEKSEQLDNYISRFCVGLFHQLLMNSLVVLLYDNYDFGHER